MVTLNDIKGLSNIHNIPPEIHVNEGICLDPFLAYNLSDHPKTATYDFDIWLEDYNIYLQRPFVWNQIQQQEFILSILLRKPIPPVVIVEMDSSASLAGECLRKKLVIDGKQRLMTIKKFLNDDVSIPINGNYYTYSSFDHDAQLMFEREINFLTATVYYASDVKTDKWYMSDYIKVVLFNFYNFAGTPQEKDHKDMLQGLLNNMIPPFKSPNKLTFWDYIYTINKEKEYDKWKLTMDIGSEYHAKAKDPDKFLDEIIQKVEQKLKTK